MPVTVGGVFAFAKTVLSRFRLTVETSTVPSTSAIDWYVINYIESASGGRGQKGGLSEYAKQVGKHKDTISSVRMAATVYSKLSDQPDSLLNKTQHLSDIHQLPADTWQQAVALMLKKE